MNILKKLFVLSSIFIAFLMTPAKASAKAVRVGFFAFEGYHMEKDGVRSGYGYDFLQEIAKYTNWKYEYIGYDKGWAEIKQMLIDGEIDIITSAQKTTKVGDDYLIDKAMFSDMEMGYSSTIITTYAGNNSLIGKKYSDYDIKIGMTNGNSRNADFKEWALANSVEYEECFYETSQELTKALENKEIDALVSSNLRKTSNETILAEFNVSPFYAVVNDADLCFELDDALSKLEIDKKNLADELYDKYYHPDSLDELYLTLDEIEFIKNNTDTVINAFHNFDSKPLFYKDDEYNGISVELFKKIKELTGLNIQMKDGSFEDYSHNANTILIDGLFDYNYCEEISCKQTDSYINVGISKINIKGNTNSSRVVAVENSIVDKYVKDNFENVIYCKDHEEAIDILLDDKADVFYTDRYNGEYIINVDKTNKLLKDTVEGESIELCYYVSNSSNPLLLTIIDKALSIMSDDKVNTIINEEVSKHTVEKSFMFYFYSNPLLVASIIVALFILSLVTIAFVFLLIFNKKRRALYKQNAWYEEILTGVYTEIFELNLKDNTKYNIIMNKKKVDRYNVGKAFFTKESIENMVIEEDLEYATEMLNDDTLKKIAEEKLIKQFECRVRMINNSVKWFLFIIQGVESKDKKPTVMIYKKDINFEKEEEVLKQEALKNALIVAKESEKLKTRFLSTVSHEIRTPLNAIIGYMSLIKKTDFKDTTNEYINKSEIAAKHLLDIVNDVLDLDAIESGKLRIVNKPFDMEEFINNVSDVFGDQARSKNLHFNLNIEEPFVEQLVGDELRLKQVLYNILSNSIKYTQKGVINFSVIKKIYKNNCLFVRFVISDTGVGMTQDDIDTLYEPFVRKNDSMNNSIVGIGLGMPIAKTIISMLKGSIHVESLINVGTTFTIDIPFEIKERETKNFKSLNGSYIGDDEKEFEHFNILLHNINCNLTMNDKIDETLDYCIISKKYVNEEVINILNDKKRKTKYILLMDSEIELINNKLEFDYTIENPIYQSKINEMIEKLFEEKKNNSWDDSKELFKGLKVLVVEDNDMNREIAVEILKMVNIITDVAVDGNMAVEKFKENDYDAILMDVKMPNKNGIEATKEIRAMNDLRSKTTPIIGMSANAFVEDVANAISIGMNDYLAKPIDIDALFELLLKYTKKSIEK